MIMYMCACIVNSLTSFSLNDDSLTTIVCNYLLAVHYYSVNIQLNSHSATHAIHVHGLVTVSLIPGNT